jgi:leucyl aminopeptidase
MRIDLHSGALGELAVDVIAIPVFENELAHSWAFREVDEALAGLLARTLADEGFDGALEKSATLHAPERIAASRVVVVGLGPAKSFRAADARLLGVSAARSARRAGAKRLGVALPERAGSGRDAAALVEAVAAGLELGAYRYDAYRKEDRKEAPRRARIALGGDGRHGLDERAARAAIERGALIGRSVNEARDLVNGPANDVTPTRLAEYARTLARKHGLDVQVLDRRKCEKLGMGLFLAVARGAREAPRFIHLTYSPRGRRPAHTVALVGKGITFDSGGLSLKTAKQMEDMKTDMAGGAAVLATMAAVARLKPPVRVHAICAATENMPSGEAYRPGDVFRGMSGRSVEVLNTDAEGRLTLADALDYAVRQKPDEIVELSTLTGACMVALGRYTAGLMSRDDELASRLLDAARDAGEDFWRLPLVQRLSEDLRSEVADCKNIGSGYGGAISAGHFLVPFAADVPFAHCDIAGPASAEKAWGVHPKGATGVGVMTLVEYLTRTLPAATGRVA